MGSSVATDMGPCINEQQLKTVMAYVSRFGIDEDAKLATSSHRLETGLVR